MDSLKRNILKKYFLRDPLVVDNPLRTGLTQLKKITQTDDGGIMITTKFPHGRETGDSVVMDGVKGLSVPGFSNCNFLAEKIDEHSFKLRHFRIRNFEVTKGIGEIVRGEFTPTLENEEENGFFRCLDFWASNGKYDGAGRSCRRIFKTLVFTMECRATC